MTNCWKAAARPCGSGFEAVVHRADKAQPYVLKAPRGGALHFAEEKDAELAAARHLISLWNGPIFTQVGKPSATTRSIQEKTFGAVETKRGRTAVKRRRRKVKQSEMVH